METIAIYPGSFDPITIGHLDIIKRSAKLFDKVIVVVMSNYRKQNSTSFTVEERKKMIQLCTADIENVQVDSYMGLLAQYAKEKNATAIVKGLRAVSDFEDEFQQALTNKKLNSELETVFMAANAEHMFLSSSMIKQVCQLGGDISHFVPQQISEYIVNRLQNPICSEN